ncbi:hypothetical protein CDAR_444641 [Caerostris darwini]|uniref:Uncharacterized protein n=1 Tax=Caerostris darwini TaxID=1538125 RepID=A0AAV4W7F7_9ARAC|nr:hypothetical protein CDAR_444641 [Caerostris darwini]
MLSVQYSKCHTKTPTRIPTTAQVFQDLNKLIDCLLSPSTSSGSSMGGFIGISFPARKGIAIGIPGEGGIWRQQFMQRKAALHTDYPVAGFKLGNCGTSVVPKSRDSNLVR